MSNWRKGSEIKSEDAERLDPSTVVLVEIAKADGSVWGAQVGSVEVLYASGLYFGNPYVSVFNVDVWDAQKKPQDRGWIGEP